MSVVRFSAASLDELCAAAERSPRRRMNLNVHQTFDDPAQRLFNAIAPESYIRPHRHSADSGKEFLMAVRGAMILIVFDEEGAVVETVPFGQPFENGSRVCHLAVELAPGTWHTVIATAPGSVLFEVKAGPFSPEQAKEFASWSPAEGTPEAVPYLAALRAAAQRPGCASEGVVVSAP